MTKLLEWLLGLSLFASIWLAFLNIPSLFLEEWGLFIKFSPIIIIGIFGIYSVAVVLWRVYTFNDCPEAATELKKDIRRANEDLKRRGMAM